MRLHIIAETQFRKGRGVMSDELASKNKVTSFRSMPYGLKPSISEWICLIGGLFLVIHYSWFMDDAFIYYRYVDNLLYLGNGLVFNSGEYVEGFSSPLWAILLIPLRLTGLDYWILIRVVGAVSFVVFWALLVKLNRRLSPPSRPILNVPLCYLVFNYGVLCYFTSGIETPLVQVAAVLYALFVLRPGSQSLQLLLAGTVLLRHEMLLPFAISLGWGWIRLRRFPLRMALACLVITGSWIIFRIYYYADVFPNTFYLKDIVDFAQGFAYLRDTASPYWLYQYLGVLALLMLVCLYRRTTNLKAGAPCLSRPDADAKTIKEAHGSPENTTGPGVRLEIPERLMMIALALSITAYVIKIGGDARHFRFLAFPFCLLICASSGIVEHVLARYRHSAMLAIRVAVVLFVVLRSATLYPSQLSAHPFFGEETHKRVNKINDASWHRHLHRLAQPPWGAAVGISLRSAFERFQVEHPDHRYKSVLAGASCVQSYRRFGFRVVHTLGLTDPILSRVDVKTDRPAHKYGLRPLARDMKSIIAYFDNSPHKGMYRKAVEQGKAPRWIAENIESIEIIEQKMFNTHDFIENLRLAFTFPQRIKLSPKD